MPVLLIVIAACMCPLTAYVMMSSNNYRINFDSVNIGGGASGSGTYHEEDTVGEVAAGDSQGNAYNLHAGYQQMNEVYVSISVNPSTVAMAPTIMAISGGIADGNGAITVKTDDPAGYQLGLNASTTPAMTFGSANFADYSGIDYEWSLEGDDSRFGFTVSGSDASPSYGNDGSSCGAGSADGNHCWDGFSVAAPRVAASSSSANHPDGTQTVIHYRAQAKSNGFQTPGNYGATITATATAK